MNKYRILAIGAVTGLLLGFPGCSCNDSVGVADDLNLTFQPLTVNFGAVAIDKETHQEVTLSHVGTSGTIEIRSISLDGLDDEFSLQMPETLEIGVGESIKFQVFYKPKNPNADSGFILVAHNVAQQGNLTKIPVSSAGQVAELVVDPNPIDFGEIESGKTLDLDVVVRNDGSDSITIEKAYLSNDGSKDFTIQGVVLEEDGDELPIDLSPGGSFGLVVRYAPKDGGDDSSQLIIEGTSKGITTPWRFDVLGAELGPKLDVSPIIINFGSVPMDSAEKRIVTITNVGNSDLEIDDISMTPESDDGLEIDGETQAKLDPDESMDFYVVWNVDEPKAYSPDPRGYVQIISNETASPASIPVIGQVNAPVIEIIPETVDFGFGAQQITISRTLTIRNNGTGTLHIKAPLEIVDPSTIAYGTEFGLTVTNNSPVNGVYEIDGGSSLAVSLSFMNKGPASGMTKAYINVVSDTEGKVDDLKRVELTVQRAGSAECKAELDPETLNYGIVAMGFYKDLPIKILNTGSGYCSFKQAMISDCTSMPGFGTLSCPAPFTGSNSSTYRFASLPPAAINGIAPGGSATISIRFVPPATSTLWGDTSDYQGVLGVRLYDAALKKDIVLAPPSTTGLYGTTYSPNLIGQSGTVNVAVLPGEIHFGMITIGCWARSTRVCAYNTGSAPLQVTEIGLDNCSPEFKVKNVPGLPVNISESSPVCFEVSYAPVDLSDDSCILRVKSNDQSLPALSVALTGSGTYDTDQTDLFTQVSGQAVDIMYVVDDSGSMCDSQETMTGAFSSFIQHADVWNNDYHIGIISLDVTTTSIVGKLNLGNAKVTPRYITPNANAGTQFANLALIGCDGNSDSQEAGLQAAQVALSPPHITETGVSCSTDKDCSNDSNLCASSSDCPYYCIDGTCGGFNKGFVRNDAQLEIIALSDEEDQSSAAPSFYIDFFKSIKGFYNVNMMHFNAICGTDDGSGTGGCTGSDGSGAAEGQRYIEVVNQTNGKHGSICDVDYKNIMNEIGSVAFGLKVQFFLSRLADPATIEVTVNGTKITTGWTYDSPSNGVLFDEEHANMPQPGDEISIHYETLCLTS